MTYINNECLYCSYCEIKEVEVTNKTVYYCSVTNTRLGTIDEMEMFEDDCTMFSYQQRLLKE